ncbi:hypothetical protein O181_064099 [Austropuccinia psidii MF-1]|uniref:Uncharacterized protein n=1 Tax=Austropuccinia psidii MF-1 TaxID=1389203 RepID=A0A9Q3ENE8_9BASI|nr:hypothetical protein [Austropuccinia psidii MF-1]
MVSPLHGPTKGFKGRRLIKISHTPLGLGLASWKLLHLPIMRDCPEMFLKVFLLQAVIVAPRFLSAADPPPLSTQICSDGIHKFAKDTHVLCDNKDDKSFSCPVNTCVFDTDKKDISRYYFIGCTDTYGFSPKTLHPLEFTLAPNRKDLVVSSGFYFDKGKTFFTSIESTCKHNSRTQKINDLRLQCRNCVFVQSRRGSSIQARNYVKESLNHFEFVMMENLIYTHPTIKLENKPFIYLKPSLVENLNHQSLSQNLEKISNIERLYTLNFSKWQNEIILAFRIRSLDCFLDPEWVTSFRIEACEEEANIFREGCNQMYYRIISQMNQENQDKFYNQKQEKCDPAELWKKVGEYYASSSAENCAKVIVQIFNLKMDEGNVLETVGEFRHLLNLLCMIGPELFREDILLNIMASYSLKLLPY